MSDLVKRLRKPQSIFWGGHDGEDSPHPLLLEAADEIERLKAERDGVVALYNASVKRVEQLQAVVDPVRFLYRGIDSPVHNPELNKVLKALAALEDNDG